MALVDFNKGVNLIYVSLLNLEAVFSSYWLTTLIIKLRVLK